MPLTDRNYRKYDNPKKDFLNLNNGNSDYFNINKAQSHLKLDFSKILLNKRKMYTNEDIFYGYVNKAKSDFYDFKYLIKELKIKKLFIHFSNSFINVIVSFIFISLVICSIIEFFDIFFVSNS